MTQTEVVDPIVLATRVTEYDDSCCCCGEMDVSGIPEDICRVFDDIIVDNDKGKRVYVTLGLFTITRLERDVEIIIPVIDYCIPNNDCVAQSAESDPCEFFDKLRFPVDEFFPPEKCHFDSIVSPDRNCGCK